MAIKMCSLLISLFVSFLIIVNHTLALQQGFTTELIHRESLLSPLSSLSSLNKYERLANSIRRSMSRIDRFSTLSSSSDVRTPVKSAGEYLMELSYGTPPVSQLGIVDTGSDLIWTQCQPCLKCFRQVIPIFNPSKSSTYKTQSCGSDACQDLSSSQASCSSKNVCTYTYGYGDRSHTSGALSTETLTFGSGRAQGAYFPNITIGCGHENTGTFSKGGSGLVGLGGGPLSLVSQFGSSIGSKFSYCLIPFFNEGNYTSKISFGASGEVSGHGVVSTPIIKGNPDTFYFLTLNSVSVENSKIAFDRKSSTLDDYDYGSSPAPAPAPPADDPSPIASPTEGNIIIDSGTTLTLLPSEMYSDLSTAISQTIQGQLVDDPSQTLKLCYQTAKGGADLNIPDITLHFEGGDLVLGSSNTFVEVADGIVCLAIVPSDQIAILGNLAQMNFLVGYDTEEGKVSFKATDCTKS